MGEFEEIVLLALCVLKEDVYGVTITEEINRQLKKPVHLSGVHTALYRLEEKGFVRSELGGSTNERGGRRKRIYEITTAGKNMLIEARHLREQFWIRIPSAMWEGGLSI